MADHAARRVGAGRLTGFALFSAACLAGAAAYLVERSRDQVSQSAASQPSASDAVLARIQAEPRVYFRSARRDEFGRVTVATLARPDDERYVSTVVCDRVAFGATLGLCLTDNRARLQPPALLHRVDTGFTVQRTSPLVGIPSRARVSRDGRYGATTVFVSGESYADSLFSTRTHIVDLRAGGAGIPDLEQFVTTRDGRAIRAADFNFWGVTFAGDSNVFFATLATGGRTYLVEGRVADRVLRVIAEDVECPSVSPTGAYIAFKRRHGPGVQWRLHVLEPTTMRVWPVPGETRSIDDQVEWLDDAHLLYGYVEARGLPEEAMNVWVAPISEQASDPPRIFVRSAWSPTVVRPSDTP
jgi:hypothetical protein